MKKKMEVISMGEYKEINDVIYSNLMFRLEEEGYEDISLNSNANNEICNLIDARHQDPEMFEILVSDAIEILKKYQ